MPSYSKASRGLFVLLRVTRIFTGTSISPSPSLRQRPSRYTCHAGRNLPDKGFRYLRTVIVTAAVHRGFGSKLAPLPLTFRHWARVSPYTSAYALAETCVFVKQSPGPIICGSTALQRQALTRYGAPLIPKLRGHFAEFLNEGSLVHLIRFRIVHLCRFAVRTPTVLAPRIFLAVWDQRYCRYRSNCLPRTSGQTCAVDLPAAHSPTFRDVPCPIGTHRLPSCVPPEP